MTSAAKLSKSFEKVIIEVLLLYMVIPRRIKDKFQPVGQVRQTRRTVLPPELRTLALEEPELLRFNVSLDCAFNASFASLNVAKVMMKERQMEYSMSNFKLLMTNTFLMKRIFDVFRYRPNQTLINHIFKELFGYAA